MRLYGVGTSGVRAKGDDPGMRRTAMRDAVDVLAEMREAVELLAREWPEDYPAGAVEWLLLQESKTRR